jgi:hypothetical protein
MKQTLLLLASLALAACSASSGVVPMGGDAYMVARSQKGFRGDSGRVKAEALREADAFCRKNGKVMKLIKADQEDMKPFRSDAQAEIQFLCLDPRDPRVGRSE